MPYTSATEALPKPRLSLATSAAAAALDVAELSPVAPRQSDVWFQG